MVLLSIGDVHLCEGDREGVEGGDLEGVECGDLEGVESVTKVDPAKATEVRKAKMRGMAIPQIVNINQTVGIVVRCWMKRMTNLRVVVVLSRS